MGGCRVSDEWRAVPGFEGVYEVSDLGRVKRVRPGRGTRLGTGGILKPILSSRDGYARVSLSVDGRVQVHTIHSLVAKAFIGPPQPGLEVCHCDGNPGNNRVGNLRWDTHAENNLDVVRHGRHHNAIKDECVNGHAFDAENTYVRPVGGRDCKRCVAIRGRESKARKRTRHLELAA